MKANNLKFLFVPLLSILLLGCVGEIDEWDSNPDFPAGIVPGYKPVYASDEEMVIKVLGPQTMNETRKLYLYGDILFINELNKGIHIINFSNPALPIKTGFVKIYGNVDMAVKNGYMYVDQAGALVTLDIRNLGDIKVVNTLPNQLQDQTLYPLMANGQYFECANPAKGRVVAWELVQLDNPKCFR